MHSDKITDEMAQIQAQTVAKLFKTLVESLEEAKINGGVASSVILSEGLLFFFDICYRQHSEEEVMEKFAAIVSWGLHNCDMPIDGGAVKVDRIHCAPHTETIQ